MVDRHKGIKTESAFSLAMFRWVNKILEFAKVAVKLDDIGINEIENKIESLKALKSSTSQLLAAKAEDGSYKVFKRLKTNLILVKTLD